MSQPKFYEYAACSTCKKAAKWLEAHKIAVTSLPIVENPPSLAELREQLRVSGLEIKRFFNTSGMSYRSLGLSEKLPGLSQDEALKLLAADGKLIKRPLLVTKQGVLVGFREDEWKAHFGIR